MVSRVLIVDDDQYITSLLQAAMTDESWECDVAYTGEACLRDFQEKHFDLVLLDLMLPVINGFEVCRLIREQSQVPIIALSALNGIADKVECFKVGVDDYITKPFEIDELLARIEAVLRRKGPQPEQVITNGDLRIDSGARRVIAGGKEIALTLKEFDVLLALATNKGKLMAYNDLLIKIWGEEFKDSNSYVQDCVRSLRRKIGDDPAKPRYIVNVAGVGYRFGNKES